MTDFQGLPYHEDAARDFIALLVTCCPTKRLLQAVPPQYVDAATHMSMWKENHNNREEGEETIKAALGNGE